MRPATGMAQSGRPCQDYAEVVIEPRWSSTVQGLRPGRIAACSFASPLELGERAIAPEFERRLQQCIGLAIGYARARRRVCSQPKHLGIGTPLVAEANECTGTGQGK